MEKTSKVKQAKYLDKTWSNEHGTYHVHGIAFENGDFGEYSSKDPIQEKFVVGVLSTYTLTGDPGRHKIKPVYVENSSDLSFSNQSKAHPGGVQDLEDFKRDKHKSQALYCAKDFICAQINTGTKNLGPADVLEIAESFNDWLNNPAMAIQNTAGMEETGQLDVRIHNEDTLPF